MLRTLISVKTLFAVLIILTGAFLASLDNGQFER